MALLSHCQICIAVKGSKQVEALGKLLIAEKSKLLKDDFLYKPYKNFLGAERQCG